VGGPVQDVGGAAVRSGRNLPVAIGVGVVLGGTFLGSLFLDPLAFTLVIVTLSVIAVLEASSVLQGLATPRPVSRPVLVVGVVTIQLGAWLLGPEGQTLGLLVLVLGAFVWSLVALPRQDVVAKLGTTILLGCWVGLLASYGVLLATLDDGVVAVLAVVGAAIMGDIGGYAFGRLFGRTRIAPTVSPNKTWEGLVGGVVLAGVLAWFVLPLVGDLFERPLVGVAVAVLSVLAGFVGDLTESMVKRDLGVKDLGDLLPGHGGILDRVDGLLLALPVGYHVVQLLA
jgi:phosphatidate cytidylyltransferase